MDIFFFLGGGGDCSGLGSFWVILYLFKEYYACEKVSLVSFGVTFTESLTFVIFFTPPRKDF